MIVSPNDKIIVQVKSKYTKNFSDLIKRAAIQGGTSIHLEDLVNSVGTVVSIPKSISNDRMHKDYSMDEIEVGDTVIFSFNVIYDFYQKKKDEGEILYRNKISYNAKDYWLADITKIFGIIRGEDIIMINGYVMAMPYAEDVLFTQPEYKSMKKSKSSRVLYIGEPKKGYKKVAVKQNDLIYYNPQKTTKYQMNDKPFIILQQQHILGKK